MGVAVLLLATALALAPAHAATTNDTFAGNPLASIKQIIFVRHGQHASIMGKQTPCLSQHGMARSLMLAQYLAGKAGAPPGLKAPTLVYAMNGSTPEADPPTVRCVNTAIPYVVSAKIPRAKFVTNYTQKEPAVVAADMLARGAGETIVSIWLHWEAVSQLNFLGLPTTGWNDYNLDNKTADVYDPVIVVTPSKEHVSVKLYRTPHIDEETLLPVDVDTNKWHKLYWERNVPWSVVARQQGNVSRVVPPAESQ